MKNLIDTALSRATLPEVKLVRTEFSCLVEVIVEPYKLTSGNQHARRLGVIGASNGLVLSFMKQ